MHGEEDDHLLLIEEDDIPMDKVITLQETMKQGNNREPDTKDQDWEAGQIKNKIAVFYIERDFIFVNKS